MNRSQFALTRKGLVLGSGPLECPGCGDRLVFGADRLGRTTESCGCGYYALVRMRVGETGAEPGAAR